MKSIVLSFLFATLAGAQIPTAPGAELKLAADGYKFTEGPAADAAGNVCFTDQPNDRILKWSVESGKVADFMKPAGRSNGLYFDHDGQLVACADEKSQLWRIDPATKNVTVVLDHYAGKNPIRNNSASSISPRVPKLPSSRMTRWFSPMASSARRMASCSSSPTSGARKPINTTSPPTGF
jgi:hypothetical protein